MNKRTEKWLTVCSFSGWMVSIGALVAIEIFSQPLRVTERVPFSESIEQPFQTNSVLDGALYKNSEQGTLELLPHSGHWLDQGLARDENLEVQFSSF